jgi:cobalt-zinc-cadmium efflux system membrane fusion protein
MKRTKAKSRKQRFRSKRIRIPALGNVFQGIVSRFEDQVDTATRTPPTDVDVPNPQLELVPRMDAFGLLVLDREHDAPALPVQGVNHSENQATVFVVNAENKIEERPVKTSIETPSNVEILPGLNANDRVIVGNRSQLQKREVVLPRVVELARAAGGK